ncbi:MAG: protein translocase subunit SecF [Pseudomonadota bacterium]
MALIKYLPIDPGIKFLRFRTAFFAISTALILASVALFATLGLNFGVDFRGGTLIEVKIQDTTNISQLRDRLSGLGLGEITLQEFGNPQDILINVERQSGGTDAEEFNAIEPVKEALGDLVVEYRRTETVGPTVGEELKQAGLLATLLALLGIAVYIWFRFEWQFSLAALVALAHDIIATIGFFAITQIEFNLSTLAAVLTIAGYSINDTVVIFDRVRETLRRYKKLPLGDVLDQAINRTLSRTILTSVTTLLALFALLVFGGENIRGLTLGLIWGVAIGTYSSVGLAVPLLSLMKLRRSTLDDEEKPTADAASETG